MAESGDYRSVAGFIQFDVKERDAGGKTVRDIVIRPASGTKAKVNVTIWPDFKDVKLERGQFVAVEGKYSEVTKDGENGPVTYKNLSCQRIFDGTTTHQAPKPETTNAGSSTADEDDAF